MIRQLQMLDRDATDVSDLSNVASDELVVAVDDLSLSAARPGAAGGETAGGENLSSVRTAAPGSSGV